MVPGHSNPRVLVTGATGHVGNAVLNNLIRRNIRPVAAVRNPEQSKALLGDSCDYVELDFEKSHLFQPLEVDAIFLIRPPQLAKPEPFEHFLKQLPPTCKIVFLSVQGAEHRSYLPHAKIEHAILKSGRPHVFIRPSYFLENLTSTLRDELKNNQRIFLPSGALKFDWIAVADVAEASVCALLQPMEQGAVEVCSGKLTGFQEVIIRINALCGTNLTYESPSLLRFVTYELKKGTSFPYILVQLLLHFLPRFGKPIIGNPSVFIQLTGREPQTHTGWIEEHHEILRSLSKQTSPPSG